MQAGRSEAHGTAPSPIASGYAIIASVSNLQVRIPKPVIFGVFLSLVALIAATLVINWIERSIPTTAYHELYEFIRINHNNPAVNNTQLHRELAPQVATFDSFVATPIALFVAGLVYGVVIRRLPWPQRRAVRASAISGTVFTCIISAMDIMAYRYMPLLMASVNGAPAPHMLPPMTSEVVESLILQTLLGIAAYTAGGWLGAFKRRELLQTSSSLMTGASQQSKTTVA